jgi:hypothetical protein
MPKPELTQLLHQLGKLSRQEQIAVKSKLEWWLQQGQQVVQTGRQSALSDAAFVGKGGEPAFQPLQTAPFQTTPTQTTPSQTTPTPRRHCPHCGWPL